MDRHLYFIEYPKYKYVKEIIDNKITFLIDGYTIRIVKKVLNDEQIKELLQNDVKYFDNIYYYKKGQKIRIYNSGNNIAKMWKNGRLNDNDIYKYIDFYFSKKNCLYF